MSKNELISRVKNVIRTDRLEQMREDADRLNSYCFFASMQEITSHIYCDYLPQRYELDLKRWIDFSPDGNDDAPFNGGLDLIISYSDLLAIKIEKVNVNSAAAPYFLSTLEVKKTDSTSDGNNANQDKDEYAHVEAATSLPQSKVRIKECLDDGWTPVAVVEFSEKPMIGEKNDREKINIAIMATERGEVIFPNVPYLMIMAKVS